MNTIHIAIGNSDDKLTQREWAAFQDQVNRTIRLHADEVHGEWHSAPAAPWQNAAWTFTLLYPSGARALRERLALIAHRYRQDSIAWMEAPTEFVTADPGVPTQGVRA